jgi:hypothetical protein
MSGAWFVEVWASNGKKPKEEHSFTGFEPLHAYTHDFKERKTDDILRVHLPSQSTDEQRIAMAKLGVQFL